MQTTIGMLEFNSIARGIEAADFMLKAAEVELIFCKTCCPGKFSVLVTGEVAAVSESIAVGREIGANFVVNELVIPHIHPDVVPAVNGTAAFEQVQALGVMEYFDITASLLGADAAAKAAEVRLMEIRLGMGIGGKSFVTLCGDVSAVEEAVEAGLAQAREAGGVVGSCVIPSPSRELFYGLM